MRDRLALLTLAQRRFVFFIVFFGSLVALIALTLLLVSGAVNPGRRQAVALDPAITVAEFARLPDNDAYPASVAVGPTAVYTGSYASGAVWAIDANGDARELPGTRDVFGSVSGLAVGPDGAVYVVDQLDTDPRSGGGDVKRITPEGGIGPFADIDDDRGFVTPDDITLDTEGNVYVTDRGRNEVWRFDSEGENGARFWALPAAPEGEVRGAATGLAYDATLDALIVTDSDRNAIYRVNVTNGESEILYQHPANSPTPPGFDGATVTPDGVLYVAALGQNGIVRVEDGTITYIAGQFRGSSDVDYGAGGRLYVANFDQASIVLPVVQAQLPFAIDVIDLVSTPTE